jgi:hypothetical protein
VQGYPRNEEGIIMPAKYGRSNEQEISLAALRYLATTPHGEATIAEIKQHIPNFIDLTDGDREPSPTRANEEMWEQQVRNIVSHRTSPDSFINDGLMSYRPQHLSITDAGRAYLKRKGL